MAKSKTRKPSTKGKRNSFGTQAELEAFVRYGGQLGELARMARDTKGDADLRARDSIAAGEAIRQSAEKATPELRRVYDESAGAMNQREGHLRSELAKLGTAADPYKAGGIFSSTTAANRLQGEKASALRELVSRRTDAVAGARWGAQQARRQGDSEVAKIRDKMLDVQAESDAYQAGRIGELTEAQRERAADKAKADADRAQSERGSQYGAGIDPDTGKPIPGGKLDPKAKKPKSQNATGTQYEDMKAAIAKARRFAVALKSGGRSRSQAASTLVQGREAVSALDDRMYKALLDGKTVNGKNAKDPSTGKVDKGLAKTLATIKAPSVPSFDEMVASIALDIVYDGHISARNRKALHGPGGAANPRYKMRDLGLPTERGKPRPKKPKPSLKTGARGTVNAGTR